MAGAGLLVDFSLEPPLSLDPFFSLDPVFSLDPELDAVSLDVAVLELFDFLLSSRLSVR